MDQYQEKIQTFQLRLFKIPIGNTQAVINAFFETFDSNDDPKYTIVESDEDSVVLQIDNGKVIFLSNTAFCCKLSHVTILKTKCKDL